LQRSPHRLRIDRLVVGHGQFDRFAAVAIDEILKPLAEDARNEVEHLVAGRNQTGGGRFEPEDRLALHDHQVVGGAENLLRQRGGVGEALLEGGIVVVKDRAGGLTQGPRRHLHRSRRQIQPRPRC